MTRRGSIEYNLKVVFPEVAKQWHPTKNGDLKPEGVAPASGKKVWWICENGHEWDATVDNRTNGRRCPRCAGKYAASDNLKVVFPEVAKQWHPTKNGDLKPEGVAPASGKKVWWICEKGHEWPAAVNGRTNGSGCPMCAGKYAA